MATHYQLRYKINRSNHEVIGTYPTSQLAYGMMNKTAKEKPQYPLSKLSVVPIK